MLKILLTGGSGFIGKNIQESYLAQKYQLIAPSRSDLDLANQASVDNYFAHNYFDVVIHSAVKPAHRNAKDFNGVLNTNLRMFHYLAKHRDKFAKLINLGSGAIYDGVNYKAKMPEDYAGVHIPLDDHGLCKYVLGKQIEILDNFVDLRIFGVFGKYEDYAIRFISNAICKAIFGLPITLRQNRKFDYLWIDDLMPILDYFIQNSAQYKAYNITPPSSISLVDLANLVKQTVAKDVPIIIEQSGCGLEYSGDNSRLVNEFSDVKFTPISDSINRLYLWYLTQKDNLDLNCLLVDK